jgi:hypothetical protein
MRVAEGLCGYYGAREQRGDQQRQRDTGANSGAQAAQEGRGRGRGRLCGRGRGEDEEGQAGSRRAAVEQSSGSGKELGVKMMLCCCLRGHRPGYHGVYTNRAEGSGLRGGCSADKYTSCLSIQRRGAVWMAVELLNQSRDGGGDGEAWPLATNALLLTVVRRAETRTGAPFFWRHVRGSTPVAALSASLCHASLWLGG